MNRAMQTEPSLANLLALAVLGASSPLFAQSLTIPPGYLTTESPLTSSGLAMNFLSHGEFYAQIATDSITGSAKTVKQLSFRQDGEFFVPLLPPRSWTKIEIHVAETDFAALSTTFSTNYQTTPTLAFSQAVNLPAPQAPTSMPMPFGAAGLHFPLTTTHAYTGNKDLLIGVKASGGLLNGGAWSTPFPYPLDGVTWIPFNGGSSQFAHRGCVVSGQTQAFRSGFTQLAFAKKTGNPATDDKMATAFLIRNGPRNKSFIQAITTVGTLRTGVTPGRQLPIDLGLCNNLMVDLAVSLYNNGMTDGDGDWDSPLKYTPYPTLAHLVGVDIYTQAASDDGGLFLSATSETTIVAQPQSLGTAMIYRSGPTGATGTLSYVGMPIVRMGY